MGQSDTPPFKGTFCPLPWMFLAVRNNGDYRICCQANVSPTRGIIKDGKRNTNAGVDDPEQVRNLDLMKEARRLMLEGKWPKSCKRCMDEESSGLRSRRTYENQNWGHLISQEGVTPLTKSDGTIDTKELPILSYDLRFGNKCNLKCRMCGPADSDFWYGDHAELYGPSFDDTQGKVVLEEDEHGRWRANDPGYTWYDEGKSFWSKLREGLPHLKHLHIVGGEPLLLKKHYDLLEEIVASGHSKQISLEYNTNLTVLPERVLELWRSFQNVRVGVSLDGVGALNELIRFPSKWSVVEENLHRLDQAPGPIEAWISATVQIYNIFHLPDLILWRLRSGFKRINSRAGLPIITSHALHKPEHLNIQALPIEIKDQVEKRFADFKKEFRSVSHQFQHPKVSQTVLEEKVDALLDGYVKFMRRADQSRHFSTFKDYTADLDRLRKQNTAALCPDLF